MTTTHHNPAPAPGAEAALAGYEYQLDVSVLAALRLMVVNNSTDRVTLEPANEEDLEADLEHYLPGRVVPSSRVSGGYKLVVQIKLWNGEPWSVEDFIRLLKHGKVRTPAFKHLENIDTHFLLVTNAGVKGVAMDLQVADFEESPDPQNFPTSLNDTLKHQPEGRVAIWGGLTPRQVLLEIDHILSVVLRIPHPQRENCRKALQEHARERMRGSSSGLWTKIDLLKILSRHGGYVSSSEELKVFVEPANFSSMLALLEKRNAIVISGSSGTGKTMAALKMCELVQLKGGGLNLAIISPNDGPSAVRRDMRAGPTLFYIEDPWGEFSLHSQADSWATQLPKLLRSAGLGAQFVITSRRDMLREAKATDGLKPWMIELNAEHYDGGELEKIYEKQMDHLPDCKQPLALRFRRRALDGLKSPQELGSFFSSLLEEPEQDEEEHAFLARIMDEAHRDAVTDVVFRYLDSFGDTRLAAAIWALLGRRGVTRQELVRRLRQLRGAELDFGDPLQKAVDRLVATKHLRQPAQLVSYAHPSVREGFEKFLDENWYACSSTLAVMIAALTQIDGAVRQESMESAAHILIAILELTEDGGRKFNVPAEVQNAIDVWIAEALLDVHSNFPALIHLAAKIGSQTSIPSELARWLLAQTQPNSFDDPDEESEIDPTYSPEWFEQVQMDCATLTICDRFVREMLLQESDFVSYDFPEQLNRIAPGLAPAFLAAVASTVGQEIVPNIFNVVDVAFKDNSGLEEVLCSALDAGAQVRIRSSAKSEQMIAIFDEDIDAPSNEFYDDILNRKGANEEAIVTAYIAAKRIQGRWCDIASHHRMAELRLFWAKQIEQYPISSSTDPATGVPGSSGYEEVEALLSLSLETSDETAAWKAATSSWCSDFEVKLKQRLIDNKIGPILNRVLVNCAVENAPHILQEALLSSMNAHVKLVSLVADLFTLTKRSNVGPMPLTALDGIPVAQGMLRAFGPTVSECAPMSSLAMSLLEGCVLALPKEVLAVVVPSLIASGKKPIDAISRWLSLAVDSTSAIAAANAAVLTQEPALIELALKHNRADARCIALTYFSSLDQEVLPAPVLKMWNDRSNKVLSALVDALKGRFHESHEEVLGQLIFCQWSGENYSYDGQIRLTVARSALEELSAYPRLQDTSGERLLELAWSTADQKLSRDAFRVAASHCGESIRQQLWAMTGNAELLSKRVAAISALSRAPFVERSILDAIEISDLLKWPPALTVAATELVAKHAEVSAAARMIEELSFNDSHKVLLVVGAFSFQKRDREIADNLLALLPEYHPARQLLDDGVGPLPESALNDLGDVRLRHYVGVWLQIRSRKTTMES